jgi:DegV family protein with EDD domain
MIKLVTDSTSYIPASFIQEYDLSIVPLKVQFSHKSYDENIGINNQHLYRRLATTPEFPTTSQPSTDEFKKMYRQLLSQNPGAKILVLTVSSKLSGTHYSALTAAKQLSQAKIIVFDSLSVGMGLGLLVITAAEMVHRQYPLAAILSHLEQMRRKISIFLMVDSLEYLKHSGRIGPASAFLGTLLSTKPILAIVHGKIVPVYRVRGKKRALKQILKELELQLPSLDHPVQAGVMHVAAQAEMETLAQMIRARFNVTRLFTAELGPVIGVHVGPGALGAGICPEFQCV